MFFTRAHQECCQGNAFFVHIVCLRNKFELVCWLRFIITVCCFRTLAPFYVLLLLKAVTIRLLWLETFSCGWVFATDVHVDPANRMQYSYSLADISVSEPGCFLSQSFVLDMVLYLWRLFCPSCQQAGHRGSSYFLWDSSRIGRPVSWQ